MVYVLVSGWAGNDQLSGASLEMCRHRAERWLAASLDETIRLQLNPTAELRAIPMLFAPGWIH